MGKDWPGLEFGEGIPGTVGGGLVMNAGAFGGEMARVVTLVHGVTESGEALALSKDEVKFAYRRTELPTHFIITRVDFRVGARRSRAAARAKVAELHAKRVGAAAAWRAERGIDLQESAGQFCGPAARRRGAQGHADGRRGVFGSACEFYRQSWRRAGR